MCFEQYSHEPNIATLRFWSLRELLATETPAELPRLKRANGHAALAVMERHLATAPFFVADRYTVADIALYAYTHVAGEGGFDLGRYPAVQRWLRARRGAAALRSDHRRLGVPASPLP